MLQRIRKRDLSLQAQIRYSGKVLLIDTDPLDLATYSEIFRSQGHEIVSCASYADAVQHFQAGGFDLVVVNQGGPNFEGRVVLEQLARLSRHIPTLILARHKDMRCYLNALELGADDYFEKPVSSSELKRAVEANVAPRMFIGNIRD